MYAARDRAGKVLALTTDEELASRLLAVPNVSQVSRLNDESFIADYDGFHTEPGVSRVARLREQVAVTSLQLPLPAPVSRRTA